MDISAKMVSELRERSGAPLMDCKRALVACNTGSITEAALMDAAFDQLRKTGLKSADKRAGRATAQGRVCVKLAADGKSGAMVTLGCETDFVAATDDFNKLLGELTDLVLAKNPDNLESLGNAQLASRKATVGDAIKECISKSGENTQVVAIARFETAAGRVGAYVHFNQKVGALISLSTSAPADKADAFLKQLGMHIASSKPTVLAREQVAADVIEREKAVYRESDDMKGKPAEKVEMILKGKLEKFYAGIVLNEQPWVHDDKINVKSAAEKALGAGSRIERFSLQQLG
ncbi:MAG: translation elongation factor Ts [Planctomycetes bacterium]|nr:translation elongation factor Ts [Planctomycetota bacterium]